MKHYSTLLALLLFFSVSGAAYAQEVISTPKSRRPVLVDDVRANDIKNLSKKNAENSLTDEQQNQIKAYKTEAQRQLLQLSNRLAEKQARLRTLETADKPDMKAINATIDEMAKLQADKMKVKAACKQNIRVLLNDEQRLEFDSKQQRHQGPSKNKR